MSSQVPAISDGNDTPENPIQLVLLVCGITTICSVTICLVCGLIGFKVAQQRRTFKCCMCRQRVLCRNLTEHRQMCAKRNEHFLANLPEPFDVRCPLCLKYLKLMPKVSRTFCSFYTTIWHRTLELEFWFPNALQDFGTSFQCDDRDCPFRNGDILNNGHNRISCFACDYDLCDSCVHRRKFVLSKISKR